MVLLIISTVSLIVTAYSLYSQGFLTERYTKKSSINRYINLFIVISTLCYLLTGIFKFVAPEKYVVGSPQRLYSNTMFYVYSIALAATSASMSCFYILMVNVIKNYARFIETYENASLLGSMLQRDIRTVFQL